jgi:hypothetical protein
MTRRRGTSSLLLLIAVLLLLVPGRGAADQATGAWSSVRYEARIDGTRLLVQVTSILSADTDAWTPLPLGNLTLLSATLDGVAPLMRHGDNGPEILTPVGRRSLSLTTTLPMDRTPLGRAAHWRVGMAGTLEAPGLRCEGALARSALTHDAGLAVASRPRGPDPRREPGSRHRRRRRLAG